ncbi:MAG: HPr family phosphocarrier protein [Verrucomicrobiales bacterium]|nr:HPr family phosphocarrier protein [Verrucomicrobiales bacterium]
MKRARVVVPWKHGLHLRPASELVRLAGKFRAAIRLTYNEKMADARSILSVLLLCAATGAVLEIEAAGDDEEGAIRAVEGIFRPDS